MSGGTSPPSARSVSASCAVVISGLIPSRRSDAPSSRRALLASRSRRRINSSIASAGSDADPMPFTLVRLRPAHAVASTERRRDHLQDLPFPARLSDLLRVRDDPVSRLGGLPTAL